jgi:amidohydrolase
MFNSNFMILAEIHPSDVLKEAGKLQSDLIAWRRHLHMNPELSFNERETSSFVQEKLKLWGVDFEAGIGGYGVVALLRNRPAEGKSIALRADMDALPIQEENEVSYKSTREGVMHACGHDVHTTCLLGAVKILLTVKDSWRGTIKCIFQPAEEKLPGGASLMIADGVLENPVPELIFGQHVHPPLESGKIGLKPGRYMASADELYITINGKGAHGALPQDGVDAILAASHVITGLQHIISRKCPSLIPSVLTIGKINSVGGATNIIPAAVKLEGTFRAMDENWREEAHYWIKHTAEQISASFGAKAEVNILKGYPCLYNHEQLTLQSAKYARELLGENKVVRLSERMTAEDFAWYSQQIPACFYRLGTGNKSKGIISPVHSPTFDIDEDALATGSATMAWMAIRTLADNHVYEL